MPTEPTIEVKPNRLITGAELASHRKKVEYRCEYCGAVNEGYSTAKFCKGRRCRQAAWRAREAEKGNKV